MSFSNPLFNRVTRSKKQPMATFNQMAADAALADQRKAERVLAAQAAQATHDASVLDPTKLVNQILQRGSPCKATALPSATSSTKPLRRDLSSALGAQQDDDEFKADDMASSTLLPLSDALSGKVTHSAPTVSASSVLPTTTQSLSAISLESEDNLVYLSKQVRRFMVEFNDYTTALVSLYDRPIDLSFTTSQGVTATSYNRLKRTGTRPNEE